MARKTERRYLGLGVRATNLQFAAALLLAWPAHADGSKPGIADILRRKTTPSFSLQDSKPSDSDAAARSKAAVPGMAWVRALGIPRPAQTLLIQSSDISSITKTSSPPRPPAWPRPLAPHQAPLALQPLLQRPRRQLDLKSSWAATQLSAGSYQLGCAAHQVQLNGWTWMDGSV